MGNRDGIAPILILRGSSTAAINQLLPGTAFDPLYINGIFEFNLQYYKIANDSMFISKKLQDRKAIWFFSKRIAQTAFCFESNFRNLLRNPWLLH